MRIEIIDRVGGSPLVLEASQILVRLDDGTPAMIAAHYGPNNALAIGSAPHNADEFRRLLRVLGVAETVIVKTVNGAPPPAGARLLHSP